MINYPDYLDETIWPRSIRRAINKLISIGKRPCQIQYGDVVSPEWNRENNGDLITIPNPPSGINARIVVCVDDGEGGFANKIAVFTGGILTSIE